MVAGNLLAKVFVALLLVNRVRHRQASRGKLSHSDAIKDLRSRLQNALPKTKFGDRVELWGVKVPSKGRRKARASESALLASFLRARRWSVEDTEEMFI